jgi:hypothetical protein
MIRLFQTRIQTLLPLLQFAALSTLVSNTQTLCVWNSIYIPTTTHQLLYQPAARWKGVPFIFKAGKALNERKAEMRIQFKNSPTSTKLFDENCPRNELVIRMQVSTLLVFTVVPRIFLDCSLLIFILKNLSFSPMSAFI